MAVVMIVYLIRHYVFAAIVLMYGRGSRRCLNGGGDCKPFVSVVVPAHNEEKVIERLLKRICEFTYPKERLQVLVVDDGSTDSTGKIIDEFAERYCFIKPLHRSSAVGKAAALNEALRYVSGEFVYFFDADYVPDVDCLENMNCAFSDLRVGAVQSHVRVAYWRIKFRFRLWFRNRKRGFSFNVGLFCFRECCPLVGGDCRRNPRGALAPLQVHSFAVGGFCY
ncbi:MAG: glycosyltransferase family 2 protein [Candidatus Bathyarchaeia archaeon]